MRSARTSFDIQSDPPPRDVLTKFNSRNHSDTPGLRFQNAAQTNFVKNRVIKRFASEADARSQRRQTKFDIMKEKFTFGLYKKTPAAKEKKVV